MPVIKLTIMKPLSTVCFPVYSVLVEHCGSWINDFHPCLGLHSLPSIVCACVSSNPSSQKAYSQNLILSNWKGLAEWVTCSLAGKDGTLDPFSMWYNASFPVSLWAVQPTSGKHKILELLFVILPAVFLAHLNTVFNSYLNTCFCWTFAFSPYGGLAGDTFGYRDSVYVLGTITSVLCLISALL